MFKEFKPKQRGAENKGRAEIEALFEKGEFKRAYRYCRENGYELDSFQDSLIKMGRKMYYSRPAELVSLVHKYNINVGFDLPSILRSQLNLRDHHGFLKNVHRFGLLDEFKVEVGDAINSLRRAEEAQTWRVKFEAMSNEKSRPEPSRHPRDH